MLTFGLARAHAAEPSSEEAADGKPLESRQQNIGPITCAMPKPTPTPSTLSKRGFVFGKLGGHVREKPSRTSKPLGNVVPGARLRYDDVIYDKSGKAQWYYIRKHYGKPEGWIPADEVTLRRDILPPVGKALDLRQ